MPGFSKMKKPPFTPLKEVGTNRSHLNMGVQVPACWTSYLRWRRTEFGRSGSDFKSLMDFWLMPGFSNGDTAANLFEKCGNDQEALGSQNPTQEAPATFQRTKAQEARIQPRKPESNPGGPPETNANRKSVVIPAKFQYVSNLFLYPCKFLTVNHDEFRHFCKVPLRG